MIRRYLDERVAVYDMFLSQPEQQELLRYLDNARFRSVLPDAWGQAFRIGDGTPLVGAQVLSRRRGESDTAPAYPTQTALDILIERLLRERAAINQIVGASWSHFTLCPYIYPSASGLGWHTDGHSQGAFIYYAHSKWSPHWGGELLVEYCERDCPTYSTSSRGIVANEALESALANGLGYYFAPLPNRVIFLRGHTPHKIKAVDPAAGDNLRISLSGFFFSNDTVQEQPDNNLHTISSTLLD